MDECRERDPDRTRASCVPTPGWHTVLTGIRGWHRRSGGICGNVGVDGQEGPSSCVGRAATGSGRSLAASSRSWPARKPRPLFTARGGGPRVRVWLEPSQVHCGGHQCSHQGALPRIASATWHFVCACVSKDLPRVVLLRLAFPISLTRPEPPTPLVPSRRRCSLSLHRASAWIDLASWP